jgi:hypothetical protein
MTFALPSPREKRTLGSALCGGGPIGSSRPRRRWLIARRGRVANREQALEDSCEVVPDPEPAAAVIDDWTAALGLGVTGPDALARRKGLLRKRASRCHD